MADSERSVSALGFALAIASCRPAAAPRAPTSSVVVADAGAAAALNVEAPKDDGSPSVEGGALRSVDWARGDLYAGDPGELTGVAYGDLDGDGREEAVVVRRAMRPNPNASSHAMAEDCTLWIFVARKGNPEVVASMNFLRPRTTVRVSGKKIIVDETTEKGSCVHALTLEGDHVNVDLVSCP